MADQKQEAWKTFCEQIKNVRSLADALTMIADMPGPDRPGRLLYTSFRFFIESGRRPNGAGDSEWKLYEQVAKTLVETGIWKASALEVFKHG